MGQRGFEYVYCGAAVDSTSGFLEPLIFGNPAILSFAPLGAPPPMRNFVGNGPIQGGTVGSCLATCNYLWESGLRLLQQAQYAPSPSCNGLLVEAVDDEKGALNSQTLACNRDDFRIRSSVKRNLCKN